MTSKSTKSVSGSGQYRVKKKFELDKTLDRNPSFAPIENEDLKYIWAAYKTGALKELLGDGELGASEFKEKFEVFVLENFNAVWVIRTPVDGENKPSGLVFGVWHPMSENTIIVTGISWFPWASNRNIFEGSAKFFSEISEEINLLGYARNEHKKLYEAMMRHGIMRRIGTSYNIFDEDVAILFETKKRK